MGEAVPPAVGSSVDHQRGPLVHTCVLCSTMVIRLPAASVLLNTESAPELLLSSPRPRGTDPPPCPQPERLQLDSRAGAEPQVSLLLFLGSLIVALNVIPVLVTPEGAALVASGPFKYPNTVPPAHLATSWPRFSLHDQELSPHLPRSSGQNLSHPILVFASHPSFRTCSQHDLVSPPPQPWVPDSLAS